MFALPPIPPASVHDAGIRTIPLPPDTVALLVPDPTIQLFQRPLGLGQAKVGHPVAQDRIEFVDGRGQAASSRAFGHFPDAIFQPSITGWRNAQFRGLVPRQAVARKLSRRRMRDRALGHIDGELERVR